MNQFIKVSATPCNQSGHTGSQSIPSDFHININQIKAIRNNEVLLIEGIVVKLGENYYKNFKTLQPVI